MGQVEQQQGPGSHYKSNSASSPWHHIQSMQGGQVPHYHFQFERKVGNVACCLYYLHFGCIAYFVDFICRF